VLSVSRIPDSSDEGVMIVVSNRESSSGNRSSVGVEHDARAGGRYLVVPDGYSTTIDLGGPPHPAIITSFSTVTFMRENVRL